MKPAISAKEQKAAAATVPFEFCKICNLNQNQGQKHKYVANHVKALSRFLSRFQAKLSDLRFFLKNPSPLRPEHAARNRLWCVFCDADVSELGSLFVCSNAICHLASSEHLKNLKHFLWKYGGGMDRVDSYSVSEADLLKWEKKCEALKVATPILGGKDTGGPRSSKDIHNDFNHKNKATSVDNSIHSFESTVSLGVVPLQSLTNEVPLVSPLGSSRAADSSGCFGKFLPPAEFQQGVSIQNVEAFGSEVNQLTVCSGSHARFLRNDLKNPVCSSSSSIPVQKSYPEGECSCDPEANMTSGAHPPWLDENENFDQTSKVLRMDTSIRTRKSKKLNPKRVGAAWAERRKVELEMEERGERVPNNYDANWLPNFGRVWQEGTRKESRRAFEMEKQQSCNSGSEHEVPVKLQPYISKRMRLDSGTDAVNGNV